MVGLPKASISSDLSQGLCFGCGRNNPIGLKLAFEHESGVTRGEFTAGQHWQGWPGIVHGGVIVSLLDEAMSYAAHYVGRSALTSRMETRFKRPAPIDETLIITARVIRNTRRLLETEACLSLRDGTVVAEASATQFVFDGSRSRDGDKGHKDDGR